MMFGSTMGTIEVLVNDSVIWLMDLGPGGGPASTGLKLK